MKKVFSGAKETHSDILCGGHRNPYQLENAIKSGGRVFLLLSLGLNSLPGSCDMKRDLSLKLLFVSINDLRDVGR